MENGGFAAFLGILLEFLRAFKHFVVRIVSIILMFAGQGDGLKDDQPVPKHPRLHPHKSAKKIEQEKEIRFSSVKDDEAAPNSSPPHPDYSPRGADPPV